MITLQPSQQADLEQIRAANYNALLAIEPGYGKTIVSIAAAMDSGAEQILVIAPQSTHISAWDEDTKLFGLPGVRVVGKKNKAQRQALEDLNWGKPGWYIMSPQFYTRNDEGDWTPDMVIVDEVHNLTEPGKAGQRKLSGYYVRDKNPLSLRAPYKLSLSGTPARNKFSRMWSIMRFHWPELDQYDQVAQTPYSSWADNRLKTEFNPFTFNKKTYTTELYPGLLFKEAPCVIVHKRRDKCCKYHPEGFMPVDEPMLTQEIVDLTPSQVKQLAELEKQALAWLNENPLIAKLPITKRIRMRQTMLAEASVENYTEMVENKDTGKLEPVQKQHVYYEDKAASPFADSVEEWLERLGDEPTIVFTSSKIFAQYLTKRLNRNGWSTVEVSGDTRETRQEDLKKFGTEYQVAVATIASVGTGTDGLQKVSATEIWVDRSDDRTDNTQAKARLDRVGQTRRVHRIELFDSHGFATKQWDRQAADSAQLDISLRKN